MLFFLSILTATSVVLSYFDFYENMKTVSRHIFMRCKHIVKCVGNKTANILAQILISTEALHLSNVLL